MINSNQILVLEHQLEAIDTMLQSKHYLNVEHQSKLIDYKRRLTNTIDSLFDLQRRFKILEDLTPYEEINQYIFSKCPYVE